nr:methyl-accepting chemotaxis protein [Terribacillus sp. DMT04]
MQYSLNQDKLFTAIERSIAMILFDAQGNILWANAIFAEVIGYEINELQDMNHRQLCLQAYTQREEYTDFWNNLRNNKMYNDKVQRVKKDGSSLWLDAFYTPVVNEDGKVDSILKIATDVTNQENLLKQSSREFMTLVEEMNSSTNEVHQSSQLAVTDMDKLIGEFQVVKENIDKIKNISDTVKGIADQSNLLGLNASIEAARAGEHGRGFTVVASEVRKMADTSKHSVEDISNQLNQITKSVAVMSEMVNKVMNSIEKNYGSIGELKGSYERIAATAERLSDIT